MTTRLGGSQDYDVPQIDSEPDESRYPSGYCACACRDCFEIAIRDAGERNAMCHACKTADCSSNSECYVHQENE